MLEHLSISNYALIDHLEIDLNDGFSVITGETGAGKSILLGALSLVLGQRADTSVLSDKNKKCVVEVKVSFDRDLHADFFEENDLDYESPNILRREITPKGRGRAFINDTPVSLSILRNLSEKIFDIHSQHQTLELKDNDFQLSVIDSFARLDKEVDNYKTKFLMYREELRKLHAMIDFMKDEKSDIDYLTFQIKEIEDLDLKPNEREEVRNELEIINNQQEIKSNLEFIVGSMTESDDNLLSRLKEVQQATQKIHDFSSNYQEIDERMRSLIIELQDIVQETVRMNDSFDFDPDRSNFLNERLGDIYSIEQKHNVSATEEIFGVLDKLKLQISEQESIERSIKEQRERVDLKRDELMKLAKGISKKREGCFSDLEDRVRGILGQLGMEEGNLTVIREIKAELGLTGIDNVTFLFSANKGRKLEALDKVASGGELSRLMLALKSIISKDGRFLTMIFDEIDNGVSGDIADKMGSIMTSISEKAQVIAITHLPQVAAKGEFHYEIFKRNENGQTKTLMAMLSKQERLDELAKMLSGEKTTNAAKENAKDLLEST